MQTSSVAEEPYVAQYPIIQRFEIPDCSLTATGLGDIGDSALDDHAKGNTQFFDHRNERAAPCISKRI